MPVGETYPLPTFELVPGESVGDQQLHSVLEVLQEAFDTWPPVDAGRGPLEYLRWKLNGPPGWRGQLLLG